MADSFEISTVLPASAQRVYEAWLSSDEHGAMTGGAAQIDPTVGGQVQRVGWLHHGHDART